MAQFIAHRGFSGREKENSAAAFVAAGNRDGFFGIETDVHVTADGRYIIIHDDTTARVTGVDMSVEGSDFDRLRELTLLDMDGVSTRADLRLPSLTEYLTLCKRYDKTAVLELKLRMPPEHVLAIAAEAERIGWLERVIFISFFYENLVVLREHYPNQPLQFLTSDLNEAGRGVMEQYRFGLDIYYERLTPEIVQWTHALGLPVNVWTVNEPEDARRMVEMGVDYITSNTLEKEA